MAVSQGAKVKQTEEALRIYNVHTSDDFVMPEPKPPSMLRIEPMLYKREMWDEKCRRDKDTHGYYILLMEMRVISHTVKTE